MPKGSLPPPPHRSNYRRYRRTRFIVFPRRILRIPSNQDGGVRPSRNGIYHPIRPILLQHNALWAQKHRRNISAHDSDMSGKPDRKTVEAYVDDVVIKTRRVESLVDDLRLTFDNLRTYDIKLNPEKCVFVVPAGKLLGFIVSGRGIEANPGKIRALSQLDIPKDLKQIQKLTGCVAALSRFISHLGENALPLYRLLRRTNTSSGRMRLRPDWKK